jgi:hypothetical protein
MIAVAIAGVSRGLKQDLPRFKSLSPTVRALITAALSLLAGVIDKVVAGSPWATAFTTVFQAAGPALVLMIVEFLGGGTGGGGTVVPLSVVKTPSKPPVEPTGVAMTSLTWNPLDLVGKRGMRAARQLVAGVCIASLATGCAAFGGLTPILHAIITRGQDAIVILNILQSAISAFFAVRPDPSLQSKVDLAYQTAALALDAAIRTANGTDKLTAEEADEAFSEFRKAYGDLVQLLANLQIVQPTGSTALSVRKGDGTYALVPLAFERIK